MKRAVFLDRDGVLNRIVDRDGGPGSPRNLAEFQLIDGVPEACARLKAAGFVLACVTNQPELARDQLTPDNLAAIHGELRQNLPLDDLRFCPHDDADGCPCRKPKPGMLMDLATALDLDLSRSIMVGDRAKDIEAGRAAGTKTVLVRNGYENEAAINADCICADLLAATDWILETQVD